MSEVIDLIALDIEAVENDEDGMVKAFAWYDPTTDQWRRVTRSKNRRHPVFSAPWPMTWKLVHGRTYQILLYSPYIEKKVRRNTRAAA